MKTAIKIIVAEWILSYFIFAFVFMSFTLENSEISDRCIGVLILIMVNIATIGACIDPESRIK